MKPTSKATLDAVLSSLLTAAALAIAAVIVYREFFKPETIPRLALSPGTPTYVDEWKQMLQGGVSMGNEGAPVTLIEFSDLECPFCRRLHATLDSVLPRYGQRVEHVFVHLPLTQLHRFAEPAARAAECADQQGRFRAFVGGVYGRQDSLGLKSWAAYADEAGVADTVSFIRCLADPPLDRIRAGQALAEKFDLHATPTVVINGWRLPGTPADSQLTRVIDDLLRGREPFDRKPILSDAGDG